MPEPKFQDIIVEPYESEGVITQGDANCMVNMLSEARVSAAYWQGRCEGLDLVVAHLKVAHDREIERLREGHELTIGYLKDRLNRLEVRPGTGS